MSDRTPDDVIRAAVAPYAKASVTKANVGVGFNPGDHPRGRDGKFISIGTGGTRAFSFAAKPSGAPTQAGGRPKSARSTQTSSDPGTGYVREMTPSTHARQVARVRASALLTRDEEGKGHDRNKTRRVLRNGNVVADASNRAPMAPKGERDGAGAAPNNSRAPMSPSSSGPVSGAGKNAALIEQILRNEGVKTEKLQAAIEFDDPFLIQAALNTETKQQKLSPRAQSVIDVWTSFYGKRP